MAGILDFLYGSPSFTNDPAATNRANPALWGALNQVSPIGNASPQDLAALNAAALGGMGVDPNNSGAPPVSVFPNVAPPAAAPAAPATGFGAGATPFGFAGPGSNVVNPSQIAPPSPIGPPAPPQVAQAAPSSDLSSVNRSPAPDSMVPVGADYQMPMFGQAPAAPAAAPAAAPVRPPIAPVVTGSPSPTAPFSFGGAGAGIGDRFAKATRGFLGNLGNGPVGALAGGLGALVTGQSTDPASIAAEQSSYTAQALLKKGASAAEVQAARYNPALQKALIDEYYGKDKWNVVQVGEDNGTKIYKQQNQVDGTLRDIPGVSAPGGGANSITGPDGRQIPIPAGLSSAARKEFEKRVAESSADAATGKATEAQAKASSFAARMTQAEGVLGGLQNQGLSFGNKAAGEIPMVGNYMQSPDYQKYKQASSAFITALLRQESGAAINKSEFDRYEKELFPQPGDGPEVVTQKANQRAAAIQQMSRAAGPGYKAPAPGGTVNVGGSAINWSVK